MCEKLTIVQLLSTQVWQNDGDGSRCNSQNQNFISPNKSVTIHAYIAKLYNFSKIKAVMLKLKLLAAFYYRFNVFCQQISRII